MSGVRHWFRREVEDRLRGVVGGPARLRVVVLLACVLALDAADKATIGATAAQLEQALGIGNTQIGYWSRCPPGSGRSPRCRSGRSPTGSTARTCWSEPSWRGRSRWRSAEHRRRI